MQPFLKWAGGKRWLVQQGLPLPADHRRLIEPFAGGAAVFFSLQPASALLADVNPELINLYEVVRDQPEKLRRVLEWYQANHGRDQYYKTRSRQFSSPLLRAARMLYLNRTCWNGLYRVNRRGEFNVPIGTKSAVIMLTDDFIQAGSLLQRADLRCQDFEATISQAGDGDFLFVDPPYTVRHNMNGFLKYNEDIFNWDDQVRLADCLNEARLRGAAIVVTNADHPSVRELYVSSFGYSPVERQSVLSGPAHGRGRTTEALFFANMRH
jgi:DNA adenine methylase